MKLPIYVYDDQSTNCLDNTIRAVAVWSKRDWELMCMTLWKYNFHRINFQELNKGVKYTQFDYTNTEETLYLLEKYHAIKTNKHSYYFDKTKDEIIKELKRGMPVTIYIDSYYCPWFKPKYKRVHSTHFCLVIGIDDEEKGFWISDGQMATDGVYLPFDEYSKGFGSYITYKILSLDKKDNISCEEVLSIIIKELINGSYNAFNDIRQFSRNLEKNMQYYDKWHKSDFHEEFLITSKRLKALFNTFSYLYKTHGINELLNLSERINACADRWMSIYGMYVKTFFSDRNNNVINRICNKITEAANEDEKIYYDIVKLLDGDKFTGIYDISSDSVFYDSITDYYFIDINNYVNNIGFNKNINDKCPGFSYGGRYYIGEGLPENKLWEKDNMKFNFPNIDTNVYDNISCLGQEIKVDKDKYSYIMLLGASELGNQIDDLFIYYEDGTVEKSTITISTWRSSKPTYQERIMWCGKSHCEAEKKVGMEPQKAYIYAIINKVKNNIPIEKIQLPICPNIHIFAMTLGR